MGIERELRIAMELNRLLDDIGRPEPEVAADLPGRRTLVEPMIERIVAQKAVNIPGRGTLVELLLGTATKLGLNDFRVLALKDVLRTLRGHRGRCDATAVAADRNIARHAMPIGVPPPTVDEQRAPYPADAAAGQALWRASERHAATLYRQALDAGEASPEDPAVEAALARTGGGQPLPADVRCKLEFELDISLNRVRIHTDSVAANAAHAVRARAFTVGDDIFFADGAYAPETPAGHKLLAHELAHVVQGYRHRTESVGTGIKVSGPDEPLEREADAVADQMGDLRATSQDAQEQPAAKSESIPSGGGQPLAESVRIEMEARLGAELSAVRVFEGPHVAELGAAAFTRGTEVHFAPGHYDSGSASGNELLGHELMHVVQQASGRVAATGDVGGHALNDDTELEREADTAGARVMPEPARSKVRVQPASSGVIQRQKSDAQKYWTDNRLGDPSKEVNKDVVRHYVADKSNPKAFRQGLLEAWNRDHKSTWRISAPSDLASAATSSATSVTGTGPGHRGAGSDGRSSTAQARGSYGWPYPHR